MEIETKKLTPGMTLSKDVIGKSGNTIIAKNMELTEVHIEFMEKFLIETVSVSPLVNSTPKQVHTNNDNVKKETNLFTNEYEAVVHTYEKLFTTWQNSIPIDMYKVRSIFVSFFEKVTELTMETILKITSNHPHTNMYHKSVSISLVSVFLAYKLNYEKKDWLQIGFAALLSDVGMAKINLDLPESMHTESVKKFEMHPIYSYKMVENITTLTQQAKMGILQHEERLDGSGYPAKATSSKIHPYARFIAVSDFFVNNNRGDVAEVIRLLEEQNGRLDDSIVKKLVTILKNK